jgi:hypothetical protein
MISQTIVISKSESFEVIPDSIVQSLDYRRTLSVGASDLMFAHISSIFPVASSLSGPNLRLDSSSSCCLQLFAPSKTPSTYLGSN